MSGLRMNIRILAVAILLFALKPSIINNVYAHELHTVKSGNILAIGSGDACTTIDYGSPVGFAYDNSTELFKTANDFSWSRRTPEEQVLCDKIKTATTIIKIWRVAKNRDYPTRPLADIITGNSTGFVIPVGTECGKEVKPWNTRYSWREVILNGKVYMAVCE